jgi:hypothetical protein
MALSMAEGVVRSAMISHSSRDGATASELCAALEARGLSCWIAPRNVTPGQDYAAEIVRGIERSAAMVLLVSSDSNVSAHVLREVEQAIKLRRPIFPLFLEDVRLSRRLDYYIAPIHWLHLGAASLDQHAETLKKAIEHDGDWTAESSAPTLARTLRYRPLSKLAVPFSASFLAGAILLGAAWWMYQHERQAEMAAIDQSANSLGYVSLTSAEIARGSSPTVRLNGAVFLFNGTTSYADVRAQLNTGASGDSGRIVDVSAHLDTQQVGGAQQFSLEMDVIGGQVIACLSMPHPRRPGHYRVTDVYKATRQATGDTVRVSFARSADSRVTLEQGEPCQ